MNKAGPKGSAREVRRITFIARCTTCKRTFEMTQSQVEEARDVGCPFSPCCGAVATVDTVEAKNLVVMR